MKNKEKELEKKYSILVKSDIEFWGIVSAMPTKSYTCLTNISEGYTVALYISK